MQKKGVGGVCPGLHERRLFFLGVKQIVGEFRGFRKKSSPTGRKGSKTQNHLNETKKTNGGDAEKKKKKVSGGPGGGPVGLTKESRFCPVERIVWGQNGGCVRRPIKKVFFTQTSNPGQVGKTIDYKPRRGKAK